MDNKNRFTTSTRKITPGRGKEPLSVVILSSLPGNRMRSYGPQCLIKTKNGKTLLDIQCEHILNQYSNVEFVVVGGFEIDKLLRRKPNNVRIVENTQYEETNEVAEARLGINNITTDNVLIICGDIYLSKTSIQNITTSSTVVIDGCGGMLSTDPTANIEDNQLSLLSLLETGDKWAKIVYMCGKEFSIFKTFVNNRDNSKLFLFEAINYIIDKKGIFSVKSSSGNIHVDSSREIMLI